MKKRHPESIPGTGIGKGRFAVRVGKLYIHGFRYPMTKSLGQKDNVVEDDEIRVASGLFACLSKGKERCYEWRERDSAQYCADAVSGEVVELK